MAAPEFDDEFDEEEEDDGLAEVSEDDTDVVFGNGPINRPSMVNFINKYPDSALRFLTRRDLMVDPFARNSNRSTKSGRTVD